MFIIFKYTQGAILHEYSRYKTGIIHEYSRIYTMNIHELFRIFINYSWARKQCVEPAPTSIVTADTVESFKGLLAGPVLIPIIN